MMVGQEQTQLRNEESEEKENYSNSQPSQLKQKQPIILDNYRNEDEEESVKVQETIIDVNQMDSLNRSFGSKKQKGRSIEIRQQVELNNTNVYHEKQQFQLTVRNRTQKIGHNVIKGSSTIDYIPFQKTIIEYKDEKKTETVPVKKTIIEYRQEKREEIVAVPITKFQYYAVEHIKKYVPQYIEQKYVQMVEKKVPYKKIQYIPVTKQIVRGKPIWLDAEQNHIGEKRRLNLANRTYKYEEIRKKLERKIEEEMNFQRRQSFRVNPRLFQNTYHTPYIPDSRNL